MRRQLLFVTLVILALGAGYAGYHRWQQREAIRSALVYGRLAGLPLTATDVQVDTEGSLFARTFWLTFKADRATIDKWIAHSGSLARLRPVPVATASYSSAGKPHWFVPQQIREGIMFTIPSNEEAVYGTVWIDFRAETVYITTSHS